MSIYVFLFSWWFAPFHHAGDQVHYRNAYEIVRNLPLAIALKEYRSIIYSFEPIHFLICWVGSNLGFEKILIMAIFNAMLAYCVALFLYRRTGSLGLAIVLVFVNYYLYAMFFTLEKLKIAFTFFMFFIVGDKRKTSPWAFLLISMLAHFQMAIIVGAIFIGYFFDKPVEKTSYQRVILSVAALVLAVIVAAGFGPYIVSKAEYYLRYAVKPKIIDGILISTLSCLTVLLSKKRSYTLSFSLVMILAVLALGGDRLNMFFFFAFLGFANFRSEVSKLLVISSLPFFLYKSIIYLQMICQTGG